MQVILNSRLSDLSRLVGYVGRFAAEERLSVAALHDLNLILEELFVNIVKHGDADGRPIRVDLYGGGDVVIAVVADRGKPFNPLEYASDALELPLERQAAGGLGLHLVRGLSEEMTYSRDGDANVTTVRLRIRR